MKLIEAVNLATINDKIISTAFSAQTAYNLYCIFEFARQQQLFYIIQLKQILDKYAIKDEDGEIAMSENKNIQIQEDKISIAEKEIQALYDVVVQEPNIKIDVKELKDIQLTPLEMKYLVPFLK